MASRVQWLLVIAAMALGVALLTPMIIRLRHQSELELCQHRLQMLGMGLTRYANFNQGRFPVAATIDGSQRDLLSSLAAAGCLCEKQNYYCPAAAGEVPVYSERAFEDGAIGYFYYSARRATDGSGLSKFLRNGTPWPRELNSAMDHQTWVMSDRWVSGKPTSHAGYRKGVNYLMLDGSVSFTGESPRKSFR